jgi:Fe-S-cluster containining protein
MGYMANKEDVDRSALKFDSFEECQIYLENMTIKKFKKEAVLDGNSYMLSTKGVKNKKCVFLKNNKCSIYSVRPKICRDYGVKYYIQCPYNGMKTIPTDQKERNRLTEAVQEIFFSKIKELGANFNLVPATAKNVILKNKKG